MSLKLLTYTHGTPWLQVADADTRAALEGLEYGRLGDVHVASGAPSRSLLQSYYNPDDWTSPSFYGLFPGMPYAGFYGLDTLNGLT